MTNSSGPAISAVGIQVGDRVFLDQHFTANGTGHTGTIRLSGARIGQLTCRSATLTNPTGPALSAASMHVDDRVFLDEGFSADGNGADGTIRLVGTHIGGQLLCLGSRVTSRSDPLHRWNLDGLTYTGVPTLDSTGNHRKAWLELLRHEGAAEVLPPLLPAATFRAEGHDSEVRAILIAQRRDQVARGALTRSSDRVWARLTGVLLGYGYQPWRALLYLAGVLAVSIALALILGMNGALAKTGDRSPAASPGGAPAAVLTVQPVPCTAVEMIGKGVDLSTPFLSSSRSESGGCETTASATGDALTISRWFLQLAAWALAALFVAGFTAIVRKT